MSSWTDGDLLSPETLNIRGASATSVDGFSTNTLIAESGGTILFLPNPTSNDSVPFTVDAGGALERNLGHCVGTCARGHRVRRAQYHGHIPGPAILRLHQSHQARHGFRARRHAEQLSPHVQLGRG